MLVAGGRFARKAGAPVDSLITTRQGRVSPPEHRAPAIAVNRACAACAVGANPRQ
ncbi:hypothetical protein OHB35_48560 [Streptomyces phaeochromogenes]|uniref:Uncharacterized protein n=1 Tax=Streptomyces phaeochromogenes TaxID=1923 RepID=A0ABZ1HPD9_STRPH|nr:hypothetical protein [Streptomyces phaeochromogenes]WSD20474.1 hypothetical protein OHB35_48560 [Streptomyces phaeochromogenes]